MALKIQTMGIVALATLVSAPVWADTGSSLAASPLQTLAKLAGALVLVLLVFWVCAKMMSGLQQARSGGVGSLKVVATLPLGHRERLIVVSTGHEQLMLGVTPSRIERVHVLDSPLMTDDTATSMDAGEFARRLVAAVKRQGVK